VCFGFSVKVSSHEGKPIKHRAADEPFSEYFDASQVWCTLTGRMFYGGLRFYSVCIIRTYVESRFRVTIHLCIFSVKFLKNHLQTELNFQMK